MKGAGGTEGGIAKFLIGLTMIIGGGYIFLNSIHVSQQWSFSHGFNFGGVHLTTGTVIIPFLFGMGIIFYNSKNYLGWFLVAATLIMLSFGVISSLHFRMSHMSAFDLLLITGLITGGIGLFASSLKAIQHLAMNQKDSEDSEKKAP